MYKIEDKFSFSQSTRIMNQYLIRSLNVLHSMYVHKKPLLDSGKHGTMRKITVY